MTSTRARFPREAICKRGCPVRSLMPASLAPKPPDTLGTFSLDKLLGQGHYGCCYRYIDRATGEQRAVKSVASASGIADPRHEAAALARVQAQPHANVVHFFGHQSVLGGSLLTFECISGGELFDNVIDTLSQGSPVPASRARTLFSQIARGIAHLHKLGIGHLDVKLVRDSCSDRTLAFCPAVATRAWC